MKNTIAALLTVINYAGAVPANLQKEYDSVMRPNTKSFEGAKASKEKIEQFIKKHGKDLNEKEAKEIVQLGKSLSTIMMGLAIVEGRLKEQLTKAELKHSFTDNGNAQVLFEFPDGRSQAVFVTSDTAKIESYETRKIFSFASKGPLPTQAELSKLLLNSAEHRTAAWQMYQDGEHYRVVFVAKVAADIPPAALRTICDAVAKTADSFEKELTGGKDEN